MRVRPLVALSFTAVSLLALAGCAGGDTTADATATPTGSAAADLCSAAAASGSVSDSIEVTGDLGAAPTVSFDGALDVTDIERTVVTEGTGDAIAEGDYVNYAVAAFDVETGELLDQAGFDGQSMIPGPISGESLLGQLLGCAEVGTRVVATLPGSDSTGAAVYVVDLLGLAPTTAWGEDQAPVAGMPTVVLDSDGAPTITIPDTEAPTAVELETLKLGDGAVVQPGDTVFVQYTGVKWSDGTEFDSSWSRGAPTSFATTGVVDGFRQALEGQTVGSQVVVVIPPEFGYGASEGNELQNETLVFVVDILANQTAVAG